MQQPDPVLWSVLIATLASRKAKLARLLGVLLPQAEAHGRVEVLGLHNNGERGLGDYKQALLEAAAGEYVSFADDDDLVEPDFVAAVTGCMAAGPDYVAFRHAYYEDGVPQLPVVTGIQYGGWYDTAEAMVRDVTQVNPVRRSIAVQADFRVPSEHMEDWSYVEAVRPLLRTQEDAGRVMYHYFHSSSDSNQGRLAPHTFDLPLQVGSPAFRWVTV